MAPSALLGLRYRADARPLVTVIAAVALLVLPHFVSIGAPIATAWLLVATVLCCSCHVVVHNHTHSPMFAGDRANLAFNLFATFARGHCVSDVLLPHNINHHREQGGPGDWIAPAIAGNGPRLLRLARFTYRASWNMVSRRRRLGDEGRRMLPEPFRSSLRWEKIALPSAIAATLLHDWRTALLYQGVPWLLSLMWLVGINLFQHDGCDPGSKYGHSRNFVGAFTNWLFFNNGYHTAHHLYPGMHWTRTPAVHARIQARIPASLNEPSIARYFWREYFAGRAS